MNFDDYQLQLEHEIGCVVLNNVTDEERQLQVERAGVQLRKASILASNLNMSLDWIAEQDLKRLKNERQSV